MKVQPIGKSLSIKKVLQLLKEGKKISNYNWCEYEFIQYRDNSIVDESGTIMNATIFMITDGDWFEVKLIEE